MFRLVGIEVVTRSSEGTLVERVVDHVTDTSREPEMKSHGKLSVVAVPNL